VGRSRDVAEPNWGVVLGGADGVLEQFDQIQALLGGDWPGYILSVNDIAPWVPYPVDHWCSMHHDKLAEWAEEHPECKGIRWCARDYEGMIHQVTGTEDRWNGSSGLYAVEVAVKRLHLQKVVLCGVPMDGTDHVIRGEPWGRDQWWPLRDGWCAAYPEIKEKVRSLSGWTQCLLGEPTEVWLTD